MRPFPACCCIGVVDALKLGLDIYLLVQAGGWKLLFQDMHRFAHSCCLNWLY